VLLGQVHLRKTKARGMPQKPQEISLRPFFRRRS
jgi:hypothetical protein